MVCPGPSTFASSTAPATLIPALPPKYKPSVSTILNIASNASASGTLNGKSTSRPSRFFVILPWPIPSVTDDPSDSSLPSVKKEYSAAPYGSTKPILILLFCSFRY